MRELTRYEKELAEELKNLPLPSEDASWEDMSKLLDDNDDKIGPPVSYRRNIILGSVIAVLLAGLIWVAANKYSSTDNNKTETNQPVVIKADKKDDVKNQSIDQKQPATISKVSNKEIITPNKEQTTTGSQLNNPEKLTNSNNSTTGTGINNKDEKQLNNSNQSTNKQVINVDQSNSAERSAKNSDATTTPENNNITKKQSIIVNKNNETKKTGIGAFKHNQENNKTGQPGNKGVNNDETSTIHKQEINKKTTDHNVDSKNIHDKKISTTIKDKTGATKDNNDIVSDNQPINDPENNSSAPPPVNTNNNLYNLSNRKKAQHHIVTTKSNTKSTSSKNDEVLNNNSTTNTDNLAIIPSQSENSNTANTAHSTVAVSNKNSKQHFKKKNNIANSTKSKTQSNITASAQTENNEEFLDTAQLIKIGQYVLANKKAKHPVIKKDSGTVKPLVVKTKDSSAIAKKKDGNKKHLSISVGIAEQQAIRLTCDCVYPNDAYTKSSLGTDYIPAVYVRIQPSKKWFVQAELKYKAPQYIQEQLYKKNEQDLPFDYTTTSYVLKKVYYNQIPVSFDYYIIPHLSVGVGVIYNNYAGQVSQEDVRKKLYGTSTDSAVSSRIISDKGDSNYIHFTKNSFQGLVEGQYDWRRFSIGVRYAIGLQPYIKYNTSAIINTTQGTSAPPPSNIIEKKNDALIIFIRFELWDSKNKKKK